MKYNETKEYTILFVYSFLWWTRRESNPSLCQRLCFSFTLLAQAYQKSASGFLRGSTHYELCQKDGSFAPRIYLRPASGERAPRPSGEVCEPVFATFSLQKIKAHGSRAASLASPPKKRRHTKVCLLFFGGPDGSRTRVRKPLDITFSGCILCFRFPLDRRS